MNREDLKELHYITPIANLASIRKHGILSHNRAKTLSPPPESFAMPEVQERRDSRAVDIFEEGKDLHDYVNLYFNPRNTTMYKIFKERGHCHICVLRVNPNVLEIEGTIVTDRNAASKECLFASNQLASPLNIVKEELVFADSWVSADPGTKKQRKAVMCAEVLVPEQIAPEYIFGVYASGRESEWQIKKLDPRIAVRINPYLFFQ